MMNELRRLSREERDSAYRDYQWLFPRQSSGFVNLEDQLGSRADYKEKFRKWFFVVGSLTLSSAHLGECSYYKYKKIWKDVFGKENNNDRYAQKVLLALAMTGYITGIRQNYSNSGKSSSHGYVYEVDLDKINGWTKANDFITKDYAGCTEDGEMPLWVSTHTHTVEFTGENRTWDEHPDWLARRQYESIMSLTVDPEAYERATRCLYDYEEMVSHVPLPKDKRWKRIKAWWACTAIQKLWSREIGGCSVDSYGGRFYSVMTNMGKDYRNACLFWDGDRISEVDVSCAQPTFLGLKIKDDYGKKTLWLEKCLEGTFYEWAGEITGTTVKRDRLKEYIMHYIYSCRKKGRNVRKKDKVYKKGYGRFEQKLTAYLQENEPEIYALVEQHKNNPEWNKEKKKWSSTLPRELVMVETAYIKKCLARLPDDLPFFTIHDCICCRKQDENMVKGIMAEVSRDMFGEQIRVKVE